MTDYYEDSMGFVLGPNTFYIFIGLFIGVPFVLVVAILFRQGTSKDLRKKLIKYQMMYFVFYCINLLSCTYDLWDIQLDWLNDNVYAMNALHVLEFLFCIVGIPIAIVRLIEPYVWREFHYQGYILAEKSIIFCDYLAILVRKCCYRTKKGQNSLQYGKKIKKRESDMRVATGPKAKKRKQYDYSQDTLYSFINSAMNIEMVYLILLGISNFMENTSYNKVAQE